MAHPQHIYFIVREYIDTRPGIFCCVLLGFTPLLPSLAMVKETHFQTVNINPELEFLSSLWGLGTEEE